MLYQDFEAAFRTNQSLTWIDKLFRALKVLAKYLNENYYCKISVDKLDDRHISFHIQNHPFAAMDDKDFYLFWGLLDMFCELLSLPIKAQPKDAAKLIEIDEEASTTTKIVVVYPYKW